MSISQENYKPHRRNINTETKLSSKKIRRNFVTDNVFIIKADFCTDNIYIEILSPKLKNFLKRIT